MTVTQFSTNMHFSCDYEFNTLTTSSKLMGSHCKLTSLEAVEALKWVEWHHSHLWNVSFQLICDILLTHRFQKQLLCLSKQLKCWLIKSIFYGINNRIKSLIINWFVMFIQIFWMCCRCCLWVSCDLMQYWIISLSSLSWKCWWWYCLYFAIWHFYFFV